MKYLVTYEMKWTDNMDWKPCNRPFPIEARNEYDASIKFAEIFDAIIYYCLSNQNTDENPTEFWILRVDKA